MTDEAYKKGTERTRRDFLTATTALAGAALVGRPGFAQDRKRNPKRGGTVRFGTRDNFVGLDTHRNFIYFVSQPLAGHHRRAARLQRRDGLVPAIATEWDASKDLKTWTFKLRRGAEFHNGETIDANAVKWNIERILDPKIGHSFNRSALTDVERVTVDDKYTVQCPSQGPQCGLRFQPHLLPGQPDGAGRGRQGGYKPGGLRSVQVQVVEALRHLRAGAVREFLGDRCRGQHAALSRRHDRPAEEGGPRAADGAADRRGRPDRQRRLRRRAELHQGARQDVRHLAGAAGRHRVHRLQPQERAVLGEGQSGRPPAAQGGGARDRPRGHPRGGVQQAGRDRQGLLQQVQPVARQGHRVVAAIRSRQGQGDAQEGQGRRRQAADHRQRLLSLHAAVGRAGARHAEGCRLRRDLRDPSDAGGPGQVQQGRLRPRFVGEQLPHRSGRLVLPLDPVDGPGNHAAATATRTRRSTS